MKRRIVALTLVAILGAAAATPAGAVEALGEVRATGLNVRSTPGGRVVGALPYGETVTVLGKRGRWLRVRAQGRTGWVYSAYVRRKRSTAAPTARSTTAESVQPERRARVTAPSGGRVRSAPSSSGTHVVTALPRGTEVSVVGERGNWLQVRSPYGSGWMHRSLLGSSSAGRAPAGTTLAASHSAPAGADRAPRPAASRGNRGMAGVLDGEQPGDGSAGLDTGPIDRRHLSGLQPAFRAKVERVLRRLQAEGWQPFVAEGLRTRAQQREKVRRGYSRTMNSRHLSGRAADIVDRRWGWGGPAKDDDHPFWRALGRAAAAEGLTWGGNWRSFKDVAHLQQ